jgi:hypothetical protein
MEGCRTRGVAVLPEDLLRDDRRSPHSLSGCHPPMSADLPCGPSRYDAALLQRRPVSMADGVPRICGPVFVSSVPYTDELVAQMYD